MSLSDRSGDKLLTIVVRVGALGERGDALNATELAELLVRDIEGAYSPGTSDFVRAQWGDVIEDVADVHCRCCLLHPENLK